MTNLQNKKVLLVVTNHSELGNSGKKTGFYLPELAHPYHVFKEAGMHCVFVSPKGGKSPLDPGSLEAFKTDKICMDFIENTDILKQLDSTLSPSQVVPREFSVVFFVGGHAPMWDVAFSEELGKIASEVYSQNGVIGAVCHGTCGLLPVKVQPGSGESILKGTKVTSFTNAEEEEALGEKAWEIMNFKLETKLGEMGAEFVAGANWSCNVVSDKRVVTGQNPQSATLCGEQIIEALKAH